MPPVGPIIGKHGYGNHAPPIPDPLPMPDPAALGSLLAAVFAPVPSKRRVMLRLRPGPC